MTCNLVIFPKMYSLKTAKCQQLNLNLACDIHLYEILSAKRKLNLNFHP